MPDDPQNAAPAAEAPPEKDGRTFTVDELKADSVLRLGVPPHAVDGAVAGERRKTFTLDQAKKLVEKFLKAEEQTDRTLGEEQA